MPAPPELPLAAPFAAGLDADQQRAVAHREGPCLVVAGPGSGKTRVIVERFLALVRSGIAPSELLVLTYTRKAADEMRDRAEAAHGPIAGESPLTTYHAFAYRVVREWGWLVGVSPNVRIADAAERWLHAEAVLDELRPASLWNPLRPFELMDSLLNLVGTAKQELVAPDTYSAWAARRLLTCADPAERRLLERHADVAAVYQRLDERYRRLGVFDHDDCILYAERLLREEPAARRAVAGRIRYVMVDEYQDTNYSQARLVETLVREHRNLLVVADDDQSIYKFRGASRANLDRFAREYPDHARVTLTHNYRSTAQIVDVAGAVIAGAPPAARIVKALTAYRGEGVPVEVWVAGDDRSEVQAVAERCRELIEAGTPPSDIAWLFRVHAQMQPAMEALRRSGVPYQVSGGRGYFQQREVKDVLALLSVAADPDDSLALLRCLSLPAWRVPNRVRRALAVASRDHETPLAAIIAAGGIDGVDSVELESAQRCLDAVQELHGLCEREDVRDVFWEALQRSAYLGVLEEQQPVARLQMSANLNKLGDLLEAFADWSDDRRVSRAVRYLEVLRDSGSASEIAPIEPVEDGIVLLTAHGAKGLEWPVVFISHCTRDEWSGRESTALSLQLPDELVPEPAPEGEGPIDEERRLFYVATTRARDRLVLTWSRHAQQRFSEQVPAPFVDAVRAADGSAHHVSLPAIVPAPSRPPRAAGAPLPAHPSFGVSDLRIFKSCPRQFEYRSVWRLPSRDTLQSWYGTLVHDVLHSAGVQRGAGIDVDADRIAVLWDEAWRTSRGPKGERPELRELGEDQLRRYVSSPQWRGARIDAVEEPLTMEFSGAQISGRLDRIDVRPDGGPTVVDYKTSRPRTAERLSKDLQVRAYALAVRERSKRDDVNVELHYLRTGEVVSVGFDAAALQRAYNNLSATTREAATSWRHGTFPARPSAWNCPRCPYRTVCDEGIATRG